MPYVLRHSETSQIYTCKLTNHYHLEYYGTKFWETEEEADQQHLSFLQIQAVPDPHAWIVIEIDDNHMKLFNVKLKNDPANILYVDDDFRAIIKKVK